MNYIKETIDYIVKLFEWWIIIAPWERGIRVRLGRHTKLLMPGVHLKLPIVDKVYCQTIRMRMISMPPITMTTLDRNTLTIVPSVGYSITDIMRLYNTLYHPDSTIANIVISAAAKCISSKNLKDLSSDIIESEAFANLESGDNYGIKFDRINIVGYMSVRTYRIIQDTQWMPNDLSLENHRI